MPNTLKGSKIQASDLKPFPFSSHFSEVKTMASAVKRRPDGLHTVTPHLTVRDGVKLIEFYKQAFGAKEIRRSVAPDGKSLLHADLQIGDSRIFLNDEFLEMGARSPLATDGTSVQIHLYVEDVDSLYERATSAGAKVVMPLADQFWGDRYGVIEDPSGHRWALASHVKDMTPEQMKEASAAVFGDKNES
jgi:PhnB protein